jgi:hypothetical protein
MGEYFRGSLKAFGHPQENKVRFSQKQLECAMKNLKIKKCGPFSVVSSRYKIGAEFGIVGHGRWQVSNQGGDLCVSARIFDTEKVSLMK